jgi:hypothetical protein
MGRRLLGAAAGAALVVAGLAIWLPRPAAPADDPVPASWRRPAVSAAGLADRSGVRITRVAVSGDGGLVDVRYQVVDPARAHAVHAGRTPPAVVDQATGLVLNKLLMGHSHTGELKPAVTYYLVFENPGGWVRRGGTVTVLLGDAQVEDVPVS